MISLVVFAVCGKFAFAGEIGYFGSYIGISDGEVVSLIAVQDL